MIYLFAGEEREKKLEAYKKFLDSLPSGAEIYRFEKDTWDSEQVQSLGSGHGLFWAKSAVIFSGVLEDEQIKSFILEKLSLFSESGNDFIFLEGKLLKAILDEFEKARAEINLYEKSKAPTRKFNSFTLANSLEARNKKDLWLRFREAMKENIPLEELSGILFWKAKDMLLKKNYRKYSEKELENLAVGISYLLPEARANGDDSEIALEKFILEAV